MYEQNKTKKVKWIRYRFSTHDTMMYKLPEFPEYETGEGENSDGIFYTTIIWLPENEKLKAFYPEAFDIEETEETDKIWFGPRFPKPKNFIDYTSRKDGKAKYRRSKEGLHIIEEESTN